MTVAQNALIDPPNLTAEAWINAPLPATGARAGIIDNEGAWGFFLHEQGELQCNTGVNVTANVPANPSTTVACTYHGANRKIFVYGAGVVSRPRTGWLAAFVQGMELGANRPSGNQLGGDLV